MVIEFSFFSLERGLRGICRLEVQSFVMYSVAQVGVGVGWVNAHSAPYHYYRNSATPTCRAKKKTLDVRFRVCGLVRSDDSQAESVRDRRQMQPHYRIRHSCGALKNNVHHSKDLSTRSGRGFSVSPRAQVPGDLTLRDVRDVREAALEESILKTDFIEESEVIDDVVALGYGWKVREATRFDIEDLRAVAHVQACSFHLQAAVFDDLFFKLFKAEVLSALIYKARHSPADRYACLLAEPVTSVDEGESGSEYPPMIVGAVNLAASVDNEVLRHLHSATEYLYVSGMAVDINYRRRNIATMLLRGCELLAMKWGFDYLVLHAYEDDTAARTLYDRGGYRVIALDPLWISTWVGRKRRVLMAKRTSRTPNFDF